VALFIPYLIFFIGGVIMSGEITRWNNDDKELEKEIDRN